METTTHDDARADAPGSNRRRFLRNVGLTAGAAAVGSSGLTLTPRPAKAAELPPIPSRGDRFTRIFRLPPFAGEDKGTTDALMELGKRTGIMDANDDLSDPVALLTDPSKSANNPDNPTHTAGTTFFGQFIDHDITFDATSRLGKATPPEKTINVRSAAFDLDSVYGAGPIVDTQLYVVDGNKQPTAKLVVEKLPDSGYEDVPRLPDGTAIIGDPRNDENLITNGLQRAFLCFHNNAVDRVRQSGDSEIDAFLKARQFTTWHYQWLVVHQFLPQFVGQTMVDDVLNNGRKIYNPAGDPAIPVEFSGAAYRFGHSMVRPSYRANFTSGKSGGSQFLGFIFDPKDDQQQPDPDDLRGGYRTARRYIGWETFFEFDPNSVKHNKLIDPTISSPLMNLPLPVIPGHSGPSSLAQRNLLRHLTWQLPSGQAIAAKIGAEPLNPNDLVELSQLGNLQQSTPLWYYVLKEAKVQAGGFHLGEVGGRIVAEVFIGLMQLDDNAYLAANPNWTPDLGSDFKITDFLTFAGVDGHR